MHVPWFWFIYVEDMARSSSPLRSFRVKQTGIGCLWNVSLFELKEKLQPTSLPRTTLILIVWVTWE